MRISYVTSVVAFCVSVLVVAIYWSGLHGSFFFDDGPSILVPKAVRLESLTFESLRQVLVSGQSGPLGRPVAQLTFALNYYLFGFNTFAFKATNLAIHLINGALVFSLANQLMATANWARSDITQHNVAVTSGVVAILWLLHPIQLLPVLHVVQRMTSLSALFLLAAMLLHVRGRELGWALVGGMMLGCAWGVLWPLSFFSKETGVLFPAFVLAWELILRRGAIGKLDLLARIYGVSACAAVVGVLFYAASPAASWIWSGFSLRPFTAFERVLTEGRVIWFYLSLIVAPRLEAFGLYHDDIAISTGLVSPWTTALALCGLVVLAWLVWLLRRRAPIVAFGIAWFLLGHLLESTVLPLEIAHEHRNYLPLFGILLAAGSLHLAAAAQPQKKKSIGLSIQIIALCYVSLATALRAQQFGNEMLRTQIEAQNHPESAQAVHEAGHFLANLSEASVVNSPIHVLARERYKQASQLDPNFKVALLALIALECKAGLPIDRNNVGELVRRLKETPLSPGDSNLLYNLKEMSIDGALCLKRTDADALFAASVANPRVSTGIKAIFHSWHADYLWLSEHDLDAASLALRESLRLNPTNPSNRLKWAQLVLISGDTKEASKLLDALRDLNFSTDERTTLNELIKLANMVEQ